jgi:Holliday junction resolvase RusA-like endonuclease
LTLLIKLLRIPPADYKAIKLAFYFPYPQSEPKKNRIDLAPMNRKYDIDNLVKSFFDALQESGVITDDRRICGVYAIKLFSVEKKGWIEFDLE